MSGEGGGGQVVVLVFVCRFLFATSFFFSVLYFCWWFLCHWLDYRSYLRISFSCMERFDLVTKADARDVNVFKEEFNLFDL